MTSDFLTEAFLALRGRWKSEDTLQDAFCRLWGGKYKVGSVREAVGLLSRTGRNLEIDEFRKAERLPRQVSIDGRQIKDEGSDAAEREALFRKVEASVDSELTELQKLIVRKHEYEGQSFERIAKDLGMRQEAVRMHISRARKILRDKFRNETDEYIKRYFDGTLSEAEELRLKDFLSSPEGQAPEYSEARAVMGYFAVGKSLSRKKTNEYSRKRSRRAVWLRVAAAACAGIFITLGVSVYNKDNVCVAYVGGQKVTDREVVMNDVDCILADLFSGGTDVDEQLNEIFGK